MALWPGSIKVPTRCFCVEHLLEPSSHTDTPRERVPVCFKAGSNVCRRAFNFHTAGAECVPLSVGAFRTWVDFGVDPPSRSVLASLHQLSVELVYTRARPRHEKMAISVWWARGTSKSTAKRAANKACHSQRGAGGDQAGMRLGGAHPHPKAPTLIAAMPSCARCQVRGKGAGRLQAGGRKWWKGVGVPKPAKNPPPRHTHNKILNAEKHLQ